MREILELLGTLSAGGWKLLYVVTVVALVFYVVARGRKAAAVEQAEESHHGRAAQCAADISAPPSQAIERARRA